MTYSKLEVIRNGRIIRTHLWEYENYGYSTESIFGIWLCFGAVFFIEMKSGTEGNGNARD